MFDKPFELSFEEGHRQTKLKKDKLLQMVLVSEAKALGVDPEKVKKKKDPAPGAGDKPAGEKAPAKTEGGE